MNEARGPAPLEAVAVNGVEIACASRGEGPAVICLHETAATSASWAGLAAELGSTLRSLAYDRRGWGGSSAPVPYTRTTVGEQASDALVLLDRLGVDRAIVCGAGIGAVAAIECALREPQRVVAVCAIEPTLLALSAAATEGLSADVAAVRERAEEGGPGAVVEAYLAGELTHLGPGAERIAAREAGGGGDGLEARRRPASLFAEITAVPAWPLPLLELEEAEVPIAVVTGAGTPPLLAEVAEALAGHAPSAGHRSFAEEPLAGPALAALIREFAR